MDGSAYLNTKKSDCCIAWLLRREADPNKKEQGIVNKGKVAKGKAKGKAKAKSKGKAKDDAENRARDHLMRL